MLAFISLMWHIISTCRCTWTWILVLLIALEVALKVAEKEEPRKTIVCDIPAVQTDMPTITTTQPSSNPNIETITRNHQRFSVTTSWNIFYHSLQDAVRTLVQSVLGASRWPDKDVVASSDWWRLQQSCTAAADVKVFAYKLRNPKQLIMADLPTPWHYTKQR